MLETDWHEPHSHITPNFTIGEACWLPKVNCWYYPLYEERANISRVCKMLEKVRMIVGQPLIIHCMIRPDWYNAMVSGSNGSMHIKGLAVDFHVRGMTCDALRALLLPHLESLDVCMEDEPGSAWVHLDMGSPRVNGGRYFKK